MANQFSNRPPFCDFLERYLAHYKPQWKKSQLVTKRVGIGRFDEWLKICGHKLEDLNWQKLLEFHRFLATQGTGDLACKKGLEAAKHALKWGIDRGELPQKLEDIYTFHVIRNNWDIELPELSESFLAELEPTRPGAYRAHRYAHRVFHTYLYEKNLSYRKLKTSDLTQFMKYLKNKGFSARTLANLPCEVKVFLYWLHKNKKIRRHPEELFPRHLMAKRVSSLPRPIDPVIDQKLQTLLENTDDLYFKSILLLRRTGLRIEELRKTHFDCVQIDQKGRTSLIVPVIKLGIERRVPLDEKAVALIRTIQSMSQANYKKTSQPKFLVIASTGWPPRYERYSAALADICARLNVKKWINLHALRHTYATSMLNAGLPITSLKEILGHKSINMSLCYAKVTQEKIHDEYGQALRKMSEKHIPNLLISSGSEPNDAFSKLGNLLSVAIDKSQNQADQKRLRSLKNRLAKIKTEFLKT